jgi:hypothetical protein
MPTVMVAMILDGCAAFDSFVIMKSGLILSLVIMKKWPDSRI